MTITTVADALAKCTPAVEHVRFFTAASAGPLWKSTWGETTGFGSAGSTPGAGVTGVALVGADTLFSSYFRYADPPAGQKKYLCKVQGNIQATSGGTTFIATGGSFYMADRLWHNNGLSLTSTSSQAVNSVAWPARDANGTTDGEGVWLGMETGTANLGAATAVATIGYTNSAGVAGRTGTIDTTVLGVQRSAVHTMRGDVGDTGVRSVQTFQLNASLVSGTIYLVAFRPLVFIFGGYGKFQRSFFGPFDLGFPEFPDGCVPMLGANGNTQIALFSEWTFAEG